jgi:hypothetical protein
VLAAALSYVFSANLLNPLNATAMTMFNPAQSYMLFAALILLGLILFATEPAPRRES